MCVRRVACEHVPCLCKKRGSNPSLFVEREKGTETATRRIRGFFKVSGFSPRCSKGGRAALNGRLSPHAAIVEAVLGLVMAWKLPSRPVNHKIVGEVIMSNLESDLEYQNISNLTRH